MIRASEIITLTRLLRESDKPGLTIAAVVGPGGVGKSYLLEEVEQWFEGEASIRDPFAPAWTVRPLIREKAFRYLSTRSPSTHRSMVERARPSNDAYSAGVR